MHRIAALLLLFVVTPAFAGHVHYPSGGLGAIPPNSVGGIELDDSECNDDQIYKKATGSWSCGTDAGVGGGEANTSSSVGGGLAITNTKVGVDLPFDSFNASFFSNAADVFSIANASIGAPQVDDLEITKIGGNSPVGAINLGNLTAQDVHLITNALRRISIASGGNVGIGDETPAELLTVGGNAVVTGRVQSDEVVANATCLNTTGDRYYGDLDCNNLKGGAEQFLDEAGVSSGTFLGLTDTPSSYVGESGFVPTVNALENALEFERLTSGAFAYAYRFDTGTTNTPAVGEVRVNNALPLSATEMYVNEVGEGGADPALALANVGQKDIIGIIDRRGYTKYIYQVDAAPAAPIGGVYTFALTVIAADNADTFADNDKVNWAVAFAHINAYTDLIDTPDNYTGAAGLFPQVNSGETGSTFEKAGKGMLGIDPDADDIDEVTITTAGRVTANAGFDVPDQNPSDAPNLVGVLANDTALTTDPTCALTGVADQFTIIDADETATDDWVACDGTTEIFNFSAAPGTGDAVSIDGVAATDPDFRSEGDLDAIRCTAAGVPDASCVAVEDVLYRYQPLSIGTGDLDTTAPAPAVDDLVAVQDNDANRFEYIDVPDVQSGAGGLTNTQSVLRLDWGRTMAGDLNMGGIDRMVLSDQLGSACFISEGSTNDANEQAYCLPDLNGADTQEEIVVADSAEGSVGDVLIIPVEHFFDPAGCPDGTTATLNADADATGAPEPICVNGVNQDRTTANFDDTAEEALQRRIKLPAGWTGAVDIGLYWRGTAIVNEVIWSVQTVCTDDGEADSAAFNTAQDFAAETAKGVAQQINEATLTNITTTGCSAGDIMAVRLFRDATNVSDDFVGDARLVLWWLIVRKAI